MRTKIPVVAFIIGSILFGGCSDDPGPIPDGMSRITIKCVGMGPDLDLSVKTTNAVVWKDTGKTVGCTFYGEEHYDVAVPPRSYDVLLTEVLSEDSSESPKEIKRETVVFSAAGEEQTVKVNNYDIQGIPVADF